MHTYVCIFHQEGNFQKASRAPAVLAFLPKAPRGGAWAAGEGEQGHFLSGRLARVSRSREEAEGTTQRKPKATSQGRVDAVDGWHGERGGGQKLSGREPQVTRRTRREVRLPWPDGAGRLGRPRVPAQTHFPWILDGLFLSSVLLDTQAGQQDIAGLQDAALQGTSAQGGEGLPSSPGSIS